MQKNISFLWPQEPFLPQGLFKHYVYLGETAQYARQFGNVRIMDLSVKPESRNSIVNTAKMSDYVFIPVEAYNARNARTLSELIKNNGNAVRIAYGSIASVNPRVLAPYFDIVFSRGNWEQSIRKLFDDPEQFKSKLKNKIHEETAPYEGTEWSHPPLDLLPIEEYLKVHQGQLEIRVQKGCVNNCSFCIEKYKIPERRAYHRPPSDTYNFIIKNPDFFYYLDAPTFTENKDWAIETSQAIGSTRVKWRTVTRADKITAKIAQEMGKNGCVKVGFGIETLSTNLQRSVGKIVTPETIIRASSYLREAGIIPRGFLIIGLPGQTADDVRETQRKIQEMEIEYRWKEYIPFPEIEHLTDIEDFHRFERNVFPKYKIKGLSNEEYARLLSIER